VLWHNQGVSEELLTQEKLILVYFVKCFARNFSIAS
jgi:hypothetical protein